MRSSIVLAAAVVLCLGLNARGQAPAQRTDTEKKALASLQKMGAFAMELAQNDHRLEVAYHLMDKEITPENLVPLKDLKDVVHLNLRGRAVTDDMLAQIKGLTSLTRLHLEKTKITDKGLANLKGLNNLEYLNLYGTAVTDAGLANLEGMKKLKNLYLWQTKVTPAGVEKLKKTLPQVNIVVGFDNAKTTTTSKVDPKKPNEKPKTPAKGKTKPKPKKKK
jgi:Leucine Rich repeat